jgi:hypothetical protein
VRDADRWPLPWSVIYSPQRLAPIGRFEIELTWEPGVEPPIWSTDSDLVDCRSDGNRLRCTARDVPALVLDHESPNFVEEFPQLVFSERRSWTELALDESELVARSTREAGDLKPLLRRLLDGAETRVERLRRLHRFVADEIRYVSLSHGASAVAPAAVARTLDRRYGDCKDKVATFLALARGTGFLAHPVLIATSRSSPEKLITPSLLYFDHMIACVDGNTPEERACIDLTATSMRTGDLPPRLYGTVALDLTGETVGPRRLEAPPIVWEIEIEATNRLACDGTLTEEMSRSFVGPGGGQVRAVLVGFSVEDRERWLIDDYQDVMSQEVSPEVSATGLDSAADALTLQTTTEFQIDSMDQVEAYNEQDSWMLHYAGWFETENERRPYTLQGARIHSRLTYRVCPDKRVRFTGAKLNMKGPFGVLRRTYTKQAEGVEVNTELTLPSATIQAEDLDRFRRFLGRALAQTWIWFSLEPRRTADRRTE